MHELDGFKVLGQVSVRVVFVGGVLRAAAIGGKDLQHACHDLGGLAVLEADALHLGR